MKKKAKKIMVSVLVMVLMAGCFIPAQIVRADTFMTAKYKKNVTVAKLNYPYILDMGNKLKGVKKVTVKSSKKSVVEPMKDDKNVFFWTKKTGTAKLTIKVKKAKKTYTYTTKVKVVKYANPAKTIKLGSKNLTSKFKKELFYLTYKTKATKQKLSIKLKKGWKVKTIKQQYFSEKKQTFIQKKIKNNSYIKYTNNVGNRVYMNLYNSKTNQTLDLCIGVNENYN